MASRSLIRQPVQGNVYYIESATGRVFTYHPTTPTHIGELELLGDDEKHLISKTNGCLSHARVRYIPNIKEVMARLRAEHTETTTVATVTTVARTVIA
jgi:hypothetical protein